MNQQANTVCDNDNQRMYEKMIAQRASELPRPSMSAKLNRVAELFELDVMSDEEALNLVRNAVGTLNQKQRDLIDLRYFQDRQPVMIAPMIEVSEDHYWKLHKIAYEGIVKCLNGGEIECSHNPFIPKKKENSRNNQKIANKTTNHKHEIAV